MPKTDKTDERFSEINWHPKFQRVPRGIRKVKIDKRFESMFNDSNFKLKHAVDKRGRPLARTSAEDLRRFYDLSSSASGSDEDEKNEEDKDRLDQKSESKTRKDSKKAIELDSDGSDDEEDEKEEIRIDLARGEGNLSTSSSDSSSEWEFEAGDNDMGHDWEEIDSSRAPPAEKPTTRLAICNMDWERITARDLFCLMNSFMPTSGSIRSVKIYLSDFGQQRLDEEQKSGPKELRELKNEDLVSDNDEEDGPFVNKTVEMERNRVLLEKLRQYELNRLKYYYAVAEFDSSETAEFVYTNCDGMEYETSGTKLDLRFVPDDMEFDRQPKDEATSTGDLSSYHPKLFVNKALQQSRPVLTWEEERDPERKELTRKAFENPEEWDRLGLDNVLASPSGSEESDKEERSDVDDQQMELSGSNSPEEVEVSQTTQPQKAQPLLSMETQLQKNSSHHGDDDDMEMEIKWDSKVEENLDGANIEKDDGKKLTQWEKYLERRKEKRRQRKEEIRQRRLAVKRQRFGSTGSDDELDFDEQQSTKKRNRKKSNATTSVDDDQGSKAKAEAELELLLEESDNDTKRRHFSLKKLLKDNGKSSSKKQKSASSDDAEEDFVINVEDPRFGAIYTSHLYNIDPSDPAFKKTPGMRRLVEEKLTSKRQGKSVTTDPTMVPEKVTDKRNDIDLSLLAKKVKAKADSIKKGKRLKNSGSTNLH